MSASPEQLHELLMYCIGFARTMLENSGEFYPFGATLSQEGKVVAVGGSNGEEQPKSTEIYQLLADAFSAGAKSGQHLGVALAANVNIPTGYSSPSPDGLRVHLESNGYSRFIYVPYKVVSRGLFKPKRVAQLSEPFSVDIPPQFFAMHNA